MKTWANFNHFPPSPSWYVNNPMVPTSHCCPCKLWVFWNGYGPKFFFVYSWGYRLLFPQTKKKKTGPDQGPVSRKSRELSGPEKPFVKLRPAYSVKLIFSHVVKGIKIKITAKFRASRRLRFEDTKRIMSPEIRPKSFGTFEKQVPVSWF